MAKTMRVTLEVDVDDLSPSAMAEARGDMDDGESPPTLASTTAKEAARALENINEHTGGELFAGSGIYVRFLECRVVSARWKRA